MRCVDLLQASTGCCSRVAGELVLCSAALTARSIGYTGLSSRGGRGCPLSGLWPFVRRYTSCSAPYPLAGGSDGHEGPPQGGASEPDAAAALLGLRLARDKNAPCAGEGTAIHGARCALNVQLGLAAPYQLLPGT